MFDYLIVYILLLLLLDIKKMLIVMVMILTNLGGLLKVPANDSLNRRG